MQAVKKSMRLRSVLYLPASNLRAIEKSMTEIEADAFIYDLEDAVAPDKKDVARKNAKLVFEKDRNLFGSRRILRINARNSPYFEDDLDFLSTLGEYSPDAVLIPKVESIEDFSEVNSNIPIWCMIETPLGVLNSQHIMSHQSVTTAVLGLEDLRAELGCATDSSRSTLQFSMQQVLLAAKAFDKSVLDGVFVDIKNLPQFEAECVQGRRLGFAGKTLIHPTQIDLANRIYSPTKEEIQEAIEIISAFEAAQRRGEGITTLNNKLIEELHVRRAKRLLEEVDEDELL